MTGADTLVQNARDIYNPQPLPVRTERVAKPHPQPLPDKSGRGVIPHPQPLPDKSGSVAKPHPQPLPDESGRVANALCSSRPNRRIDGV